MDTDGLHQRIENNLKDILAIDDIEQDGEIVWVRGRATFVNEALNEALRDRLASLGLEYELTNLYTVSDNGNSHDAVTLRLTARRAFFEKAIGVQRKAAWRRWISSPWVNVTLFVLTTWVVFTTGATTI